MSRNMSSAGMRLTAVEIGDGDVALELDRLVNSIPTTDTFHHLGHEGKVFIHSERHSGIAATGGIDETIIRIPAGNADRQVHFRFITKGRAVTGILDVDVELFSGITASVDGTPLDIVSTNDAVVKSTGVLMFGVPTITDDGNFKGAGALFGDNKSTGTQDMAVPEFVMVPNGANARDYLLRATNNGSGIVDLLHNLFFYDSAAS